MANLINSIGEELNRIKRANSEDELDEGCFICDIKLFKMKDELYFNPGFYENKVCEIKSLPDVEVEIINSKDDQGKTHKFEMIRSIGNCVSVVNDLDNPDRGECALKKKRCTSKYFHYFSDKQVMGMTKISRRGYFGLSVMRVFTP